MTLAWPLIVQLCFLLYSYFNLFIVSDADIPVEGMSDDEKRQILVCAAVSPSANL